jgi:hypothetical protein
MFDKVDPIVGIVENMSYYLRRLRQDMMFSRGGAKKWRKFKSPILAKFRLPPRCAKAVTMACRFWCKIPIAGEQVFLDIAAKLAGQLSIASSGRKKFKD